jgi:hypothetical protein
MCFTGAPATASAAALAAPRARGPRALPHFLLDEHGEHDGTVELWRRWAQRRERACDELQVSLLQ